MRDYQARSAIDRRINSPTQFAEFLKAAWDEADRCYRKLDNARMTPTRLAMFTDLLEAVEILQRRAKRKATA